jgi:zinc protease
MAKTFRVSVAALFVAAALAIAAIGILACPLGAQEKTQEVRPPKLDFTAQKLPNGLQVILLEDHAVPVVSVQVWYHVGSKDEKPGRTGFAHLFEHLMFKGSAHVGPEEHSRLIEAIGGLSNAATYDDYTQYFETFPGNYLERVLWLEADRMGSLNVDEANFKSEREVVKEERRDRIENQPYGFIEEDLHAAAFTVHGYHHTPFGSMADLNNATIDDVRDFFNTFYKPNNATLVIVGDFTSEQALDWANKYFDGIPASAQPIPRVSTPEPPQAEERVVKKSYSNTPLPAVVIGYKIPARYTPDAYPLELASNILASGESSRLFQQLVYKDQIAAQTYGFGNMSEDPNLFYAVAVLNAGHTAQEGEKALEGALAELKTQPVSAKELEKAKNQEIAGFILGRETDDERAAALAAAAVIGKDPGLVNTELIRYTKVTPADIERVAKDYFVQAHATVILVAPPQSAQ